ncbi:hypothetical protein BOTBODRAFT_58191 [Botryobasidium botryosum FD-172 SS1]|uniref:Uncharacterized protein n=1 Tax=Botryobasidium botryosum (strain FD-172 SS1) TaxID=930990 RepID=A0A067MEH0_BOTB1|nr:hypothetical protein BOTBODRAFT_58191 [Botryobasidium botryosum FD-172 SS1]
MSPTASYHHHSRSLSKDAIATPPLSPTSMTTFKTPYPALGHASAHAPVKLYPPPFSIRDPEVRDMMHPNYPKPTAEYIPRLLWKTQYPAHTSAAKPNFYLNTYVWTLHDYESKPVLGRIINIEKKSILPNRPPEKFYTVVRQERDYRTCTWKESFQSLFEPSELETVDRVENGDAFVARYWVHPMGRV